jgi:hypothetical protein
MISAHDAGATVAKIGPPAVALSFPDRIFAEFDPITALALVVGLTAGVLWRAGDARKRGDTWDGIRNDLVVSVLIGGANLIIAAIVVQLMGVPPLYAIGVAMIVAGKGPDAMAWFERRFIGVSSAPVSQETTDVGIPRSPNPELDELARRLDDPPGPPHA